MRRLARGLGTIVATAAIVAVYNVWADGDHSLYFPPAAKIWSAFRANWIFSKVGTELTPSIERLFMGLAIGVGSGIVVGAMLGLMPRLYRAFSPCIEFLRSMPVVLFLPPFILFFGIGTTMKVIVIALGTVFPVLLNVIDGILAVDPLQLEVSRLFGLGRWAQIRRIILPATMPQFFAGLRVSVPLALIMMVVSELVGSTNGIGYFILQSQTSFDIPNMWSGVLLLGLLGLALNSVTSQAERMALRWYHGYQLSSQG